MNLHLINCNGYKSVKLIEHGARHPIAYINLVGRLYCLEYTETLVITALVCVLCEKYNELTLDYS